MEVKKKQLKKELEGHLSWPVFSGKGNCSYSNFKDRLLAHMNVSKHHIPLLSKLQFTTRSQHDVFYFKTLCDLAKWRGWLLAVKSRCIYVKYKSRESGAFCAWMNCAGRKSILWVFFFLPGCLFSGTFLTKCEICTGCALSLLGFNPLENSQSKPY